MDVPAGFKRFESQGPFLEEIGPIQVRQGGLLSTFADFALGRAIEADADDSKDRATVSLTVDFLKPANADDWIESRTRVDRVGGTLAFADCSLTVDEREVVRSRAV